MTFTEKEPIKTSPIIVVTGACGFLGSTIIKKLNKEGFLNIIVIDNDTLNSSNNLNCCSILKFLSFNQSILKLEAELNKYNISFFLHVGADTNVLNNNLPEMMHSNYFYSVFYYNYCLERQIKFIYTSSAAVYGNCIPNRVDNLRVLPLNAYALSKWHFDNYFSNSLRRFQCEAVGLRVFNMFGFGEFHKGVNASIPYRFFTFYRTTGTIELFNKDIRRDYVWVEDVASVIHYVMLDNTVENGIYNLGSGYSFSHYEIANLVINHFTEKQLTSPSNVAIKIIPIDAKLSKSFQFFTKAEGLLEVIQEKTKQSRERLSQYIENLIGYYYNIKV